MHGPWLGSMARVRPILSICAALVLDGLLRDPPNSLHPVSYFGRSAGVIERISYGDSILRGAAAWLVLVASSVLLGSLGGESMLTSPAILWITLGGGSLAKAATAVLGRLEEGDPASAKRELAALVGRDTRDMDETSILRAVIESIAENANDAVFAPLLWYSLAGSKGAAGVRAINTLDAMFGHRTARYRRFGFLSAKADDLVMCPSAVLGSFAIYAAADRGSRGSIRRLIGLAARHPSLNAGLMEAAFSGALGVDLGGINYYGGEPVATPEFSGGRPVARLDVVRAIRLMRRSTLYLAALAGVAGVILG